MRNPLVTTLCLAALAAASGSARAQEAPRPEQVTPTPSAVTVSGVVEAYYTYNFNRPGSGDNVFLYNYRDAQLGLNLADVRVGKLATPASRTGFLVRLIEGDVRDRTIAPDDFDNVLEAYGTLLVPLGERDLKVDAGQFVTHIGFETVDLGTNPNFSKSLLFQFPAPFYNAGVRAAYTLSPTTTVTGFLLNRYNGTNDSGNRDIAPGFQITQALSPTSSVILNGLGSRENLGTTSAPNNKQQNILDLVYTNQVTPTTRIAAEALYRWGKNSDDNSYGAYGVAGYGQFTLGSGNLLSLRGEFLQTDEANTPVAANPSGTEDVQLAEITVTYELRSGLFPGVRTLLEYRYDRSDEPFFAGRNEGTLKKNQSTLTIAQAFSF